MDANCANLFTHQAFVFRNERQELVTAMVSISCQLSASGQPHGGFSYINSTIGTPPALIPAYSYIPLQAMTRQPSAAVRTNDNMIGDLFYLGSHQSHEFPYQPMPNNGVHFAHPLPVSSVHNSTAKISNIDNRLSTAIQTPVSSVAETRVQSTTSLNPGHSNGPLGPINVESNNVTVLQSGRVTQNHDQVQVKYEDDGVINNGPRRRLSSARRRISSSSEEEQEEEDGYVLNSVSSEKSDVISSGSSLRYSSEDSPISGGQANELLYDDFGAYYNITCGDLSGQFYISRFARGSIGKCILYQGVWHTPNSFQSIADHQCSKDWKKSIRFGQYSLKDMIREEKFQEHPKSCTCGICFSVADVAAARDLSNNSKVNQVILAKKRRLSQTDTGKSRKPTVQAAVATTPVTTSDSRQEIVFNGNGIHVPTDDTLEDSSRVVDCASNTRSPPVNNTIAAEVTSPQEIHQDAAASCSDAVLESVLEDDAQFKIPGGSPFHTEAGTFIKNPRLWSCKEVSMFLKQSGFSQLENHFMEQDVDGHSLLMLNEGHLMETFHMKLGSALKLLEAVEKLKHPPG